MMVRFFTILQRNWTYEVEYTFEILRMILINVVTLGIPAIVERIPDAPFWVLCVFGFAPAFIFWLSYFRYSIGRMVQIKTNRRYAVIITKEQLVKIMDAYPKQDLFCKVNGKYKRIKSADEVKDDDSILLITIGKKQLMVVHQR